MERFHRFMLVLVFLLATTGEFSARAQDPYNKEQNIFTKTDLTNHTALTAQEDGSVILSLLEQGSEAQIWTPKHDQSTDLVFIVNKKLRRGLKNRDGRVVVAQEEEDEGDLWQFYPKAGIYGDIRHNSTQLEMAVADTSIILQPWAGSSAQLWTIYEPGPQPPPRPPPPSPPSPPPPPPPSLSKSPQYGGLSGNGFDDRKNDKVHNIISQISLCYSPGAIYQLEVLYASKDGTTHVTRSHGRSKLVASKTYFNVSQKEFISKIYVKTGSNKFGAKMVTSLTFVVQSYESGKAYNKGPYGVTEGPFIESPLGEIVGFFGRSGEALDAIGTWYYPLPKSTSATSYLNSTESTTHLVE